MFKKTRLRILALIMAVATVIIMLMLSVIYLANLRYSYERGISLLENYAENNGNNPQQNMGQGQRLEQGKGHGPEQNQGPGQEQGKPNQHSGMKDDRNKMSSLSTFYSVSYNPNGDPVKINTGNNLLYTENEVLDIANTILSGGEMRGIYNNMPFLVRISADGTIVALIDNTMEMDNSDRLFEYSLLAGISGWVVILILAWFFSKQIVSPLEQNDRKQKQFISDAGHELKTPVSVISANADILSAEIGENKWLANIQYENERMGNLVKQLLELVRAENMQQTKENLNFSRLVSGGTLPFESVAFENGLILNTDIEEEIYVDGNRNQLSQLVSILIDNAISHGNHGKEVSVRLSSNKHHAILSVTNAGQPIPDEIKDRLFERFYRVDEARTDDVGHYGLGLAIAKAVVTAHGGKIGMNCFDGLIEFKAEIPKL